MRTTPRPMKRPAMFKLVDASHIAEGWQSIMQLTFPEDGIPAETILVTMPEDDLRSLARALDKYR